MAVKEHSGVMGYLNSLFNKPVTMKGLMLGDLMQTAAWTEITKEVNNYLNATVGDKKAAVKYVVNLIAEPNPKKVQWSAAYHFFCE